MRAVLLALGGASLLAGLDAALVRVGVWAPVESSRLGMLHGVVMVLGFLGTVISLERAQSLGRSWALLAPATLAAGSLALVLGAPPIVGALLLVQGCLVFVAVYVALWQRAHATVVAVEGLSAVAALLAAILWLWAPLPAIVCLLATFVVLTIASERTELAILTLGPAAPTRLLVLGGTMTLAALLSVVLPQIGTRAFGAAMLALALWLMRDDVARRFIRTDGLRRFNAAALLLGYVWLALAGATWLVVGVAAAQPAYDVTVHGVFLGFAVSMVMAHAPIILPAVLGRQLPYRPVSWLPLLLLHAGLALRFGADAAVALGLPAEPVWQAGSVVTVVSVLVFMLVSFVLVVTHRARTH